MIAALALEGVLLRHGPREVLSDVSLAVAPGEVLALLGPSGSGKTSVVRLLLGFAVPTRGVVRIGGEVASESGALRVPPDERRLAVVFQDLALWPHLTVRGNLAFGLDAQGVPPDERDARIATVLAAVSLQAKEDRLPGALSGGERQRAAIARALVLQPRAILLDEPLSNLDVGLKGELLALFTELLGRGRTTAVFVTHDLREARALADRVAILEGGHVVRVGTIGELEAGPATPFERALVDDLASRSMPGSAREGDQTGRFRT